MGTWNVKAFEKTAICQLCERGKTAAQRLNALAKRSKAEIGLEPRYSLVSLPFAVSSSFLCVIATASVRMHVAVSNRKSKPHLLL